MFYIYNSLNKDPPSSKKFPDKENESKMLELHHIRFDEQSKRSSEKSYNSQKVKESYSSDMDTVPGKEYATSSASSTKHFQVDEMKRNV